MEQWTMDGSDLFPLGHVVISRRAQIALAEASITPSVLLARHQGGDWGDLSPSEKRENEEAIHNGWSILSAYMLPTGDTVWVITEADRSRTTILLPEEF